MTPNQREDMNRELEMERKFRPLNRRESDFSTPRNSLLQVVLYIVAILLAGIVIVFLANDLFAHFR